MAGEMFGLAIICIVIVLVIIPAWIDLVFGFGFTDQNTNETVATSAESNLIS
jgi:peptidoglycan biosynthesis protein MviN/MurJ (putative lipid II flippase)